MEATRADLRRQILLNAYYLFPIASTWSLKDGFDIWAKHHYEVLISREGNSYRAHLVLSYTPPVEDIIAQPGSGTYNPVGPSPFPYIKVVLSSTNYEMDHHALQGLFELTANRVTSIFNTSRSVLLRPSSSGSNSNAGMPKPTTSLAGRDMVMQKALNIDYNVDKGKAPEAGGDITTSVSTERECDYHHNKSINRKASPDLKTRAKAINGRNSNESENVDTSIQDLNPSPVISSLRTSSYLGQFVDDRTRLLKIPVPQTPLASRPRPVPIKQPEPKRVVELFEYPRMPHYGSRESFSFLTTLSRGSSNSSNCPTLHENSTELPSPSKASSFKEFLQSKQQREKLSAPRAAESSPEIAFGFDEERSLGEDEILQTPRSEFLVQSRFAKPKSRQPCSWSAGRSEDQAIFPNDLNPSHAMVSLLDGECSCKDIDNTIEWQNAGSKELSRSRPKSTERLEWHVSEQFCSANEIQDSVHELRRKSKKLPLSGLTVPNFGFTDFNDQKLSPPRFAPDPIFQPMGYQPDPIKKARSHIPMNSLDSVSSIPSPHEARKVDLKKAKAKVTAILKASSASPRSKPLNSSDAILSEVVERTVKNIRHAANQTAEQVDGYENVPDYIVANAFKEKLVRRLNNLDLTAHDEKLIH